MKLTNKQNGMSTIVLIVIIGLFGYAIFIGLKITPVYMEYFSIKSAVDGLADEMQTRQISKAQYMDLMRRRLNINYVDIDGLTPSRDGCDKSKKDPFYFKTAKKSTEVGVNYEKRIPMIANIDFLISFDYIRSIDPLQK
ncbi:MAG: DUF4845 domain-containing protein [Gammaproteobacteria bacterium]|nr:DUF4845 domain-containing protein [Gammaproteobacteria bacterium]